jgi:DNA-directed RNA polymerase beta subunit
MDSLLDDDQYDYENGQNHAMDGDTDKFEDEITQEEVWLVIDEYFNKKGLVGQQLDSFDEFIKNTIQELVDDAGELSVTPENQYIPGQDLDQVKVFHSFLSCLIWGADAVYLHH